MVTAKSLYVSDDEDEYVVVMVSTDVILCLIYYYITFNNPLYHIHKWFLCTPQEGHVPKSPNLRIVQSTYAISFDPKNSYKENHYLCLVTKLK